MSKRNLSYDDGMMIWKTREAYRVQTVLLAVFYFPQFCSRCLVSPISIAGLLVASRRRRWCGSPCCGRSGGCWGRGCHGLCGGAGRPSVDGQGCVGLLLVGLSA